MCRCVHASMHKGIHTHKQLTHCWWLHYQSHWCSPLSSILSLSPQSSGHTSLWPLHLTTLKTCSKSILFFKSSTMRCTVTKLLMAEYQLYNVPTPTSFYDKFLGLPSPCWDGIPSELLFLSPSLGLSGAQWWEGPPRDSSTPNQIQCDMEVCNLFSLMNVSDESSCQGGFWRELVVSECVCCLFSCFIFIKLWLSSSNELGPKLSQFSGQGPKLSSYWLPSTLPPARLRG